MISVEAGGAVEAWAVGPTGVGASLDRLGGVSGGRDLLELGDMNGDGLDDVLLGQTGKMPRVWRYFAGGNGELVGQQVLLPELEVSGEGLSAMCIGDFDGDGISDVAVAITNSLVFGFGDGLTGFSEVGTEPSSAAVTTLAAADLDGDERDELLVVEAVAQDSGTLRVLSRVGSSFESAFEFAPGHRLASVSVGDLNGDSVPDLALSDNYIGIVEVLFSNP